MTTDPAPYPPEHETNSARSEDSHPRLVRLLREMGDSELLCYEDRVTVQAASDAIENLLCRLEIAQSRQSSESLSIVETAGGEDEMMMGVYPS